MPEEKYKITNIVMTHVSCTQRWLSGWPIIAAQREMDKLYLLTNVF